MPSVPGASTHLARDAWTSSENAGEGLTAGLSLRLSRFERALSRFNWPTVDAPWQNSRLVVRDSSLENAVSARTIASGQAINPNKLLSSAKTSIAASGIAAGDYAFRVTQQGPGGQSSQHETFAVSVGKSDTWGTVLGKVAEAVNGSKALSVQANVALQQSPFALDDALPGVGSALTLSVNPARTAQAVSVADTSGNLLHALGMRAAAVPNAPAEARTRMVGATRQAQPTSFHTTGYDPGAAATLATGLHTFAYAVGSAAQPTSYVSTARDPEAATTLAAGTYGFRVAMGETVRDLSVAVKTGWTWGDVQNAVAGQINAQAVSTWNASKTAVELVGAPSYTIPGVTAVSRAVSVPSSTEATANTRARQLTVTTAAGSEGQALTLTDTQGGILSALGLTTKLTGTTVNVAVRKDDTAADVLGAVARSIPMTSGRVAGGVITETLPSAAVPGKSLTLAGRAATLTLVNRRLGERLVLTDGASGLLASLGLDATLPGQDGEIQVDGVSLASENNAYALDSGRLVLETSADTGAVLPLTVTRALDSLQQRLGDVVTSYNDVRKYLSANNGFFTTSLSDALSRPVTDNWSGLSDLGFSKTRRNDQLWVQNDRFWQHLATDPRDATRTLVGGATSLIPAWKTAVSDIKTAGVSSFLTPETENLGRISPRVSEFALERKHRLIDLLG
ncbi:hypothetical protein NY78_3434 [Desulfovibrio sp. TomC]|nr:hypothetical protein NY78_3434 [Desulfovibrio sp. TomC]